MHSLGDDSANFHIPYWIDLLDLIAKGCRPHEIRDSQGITAL